MINSICYSAVLLLIVNKVLGGKSFRAYDQLQSGKFASHERYSTQLMFCFFIRAWAGLDLPGPYCFSNDDFFLSQMITFFTAWTYPKTHQSWNIRHTCHYCHHRLPPLGGATIEESAFWLVTHIYFVAHAKIHANSTQIREMSKTYFFPNFWWFHPFPNFAPVDSLDKKLLKEFWYSKQYWSYSISCPFCSKHRCCVSPHWSVRMTWNPGDYFPMSH